MNNEIIIILLLVSWCIWFFLKWGKYCYWINKNYKYYRCEGRNIRKNRKTEKVEILSRKRRIWQNANKYTRSTFNND